MLYIQWAGAGPDNKHIKDEIRKKDCFFAECVYLGKIKKISFKNLAD
jgi:hypothetical protein